MCSALFQVLKNIYKIRLENDSNHHTIDILDTVFECVPSEDKETVAKLLNQQHVLKKIENVTREDELLIALSVKTFNTYKYKLIESISENIVSKPQKTRQDILSDKNIQQILINANDFSEIKQGKVRAIQKIVANYLDNPLPSEHDHNLRSIVRKAPVSYSGMEYSSSKKRKSAETKAQKMNEDDYVETVLEETEPTTTQKGLLGPQDIKETDTEFDPTQDSKKSLCLPQDTSLLDMSEDHSHSNLADSTHYLQESDITFKLPATTNTSIHSLVKSFTSSETTSDHVVSQKSSVVVTEETPNAANTPFVLFF
jgi:hypothetical protein